MAADWYVRRGTKQVGPFDPRQMKEFARDGKISPESFVMKGTEGGWIHAKSVDGLFEESSADDAPATPATSDETFVDNKKQSRFMRVLLRPKYIGVGIAIVVLIIIAIYFFVPGFKPKGYYVTDSLPFAGLGQRFGDMNSKKGKVFVVIVTDIPASFWTPTNAEDLNQSDLKAYSPQRFTLVMSDGQEQSASFIAAWPFDDTGGFTVGFVETSPNLSLSGTERVAVAFVVDKVDGTKPMQIQFDDMPPRTVPSNEIPPR